MVKVQTAWMPTVELRSRFHPLNPNQYDDIAGLALSLLDGGWVEPITLNTRNNLLVGGHHRVRAAEWLSQQAIPWFEHRWQVWSAENGNSENDRDRFTQEYWTNCLVLLVDLSEAEHEAMLLRLNDTDAQGKDNPDRLKAVLSGLGDRLRALANGTTPQNQALEQTEPEYTDRVDRQVFERPDATDYRVKDAPEPDTAEHFSGDVTTAEDDDDEDFGDEWDEEGEDEEPAPAPTKAPSPVHALAVSLPWSQWKQWNNYKRSRGISKDTDAFVAGHAAYQEDSSGEA